MKTSKRDKQVSNLGIPPAEEGVAATDGLDEAVEAVMDRIEQAITGDDPDPNAQDRKRDP
jgi:hypothetical protein